MCGIYGSVGNTVNIIDVAKCLKKLEYRGYDSSGIGYVNNNNFKITKSVGNVSKIIKKIKKQNTSTVIAHTRWATHGKVSKKNAHPHISFDGRFILVHNGIINNSMLIKEKYLSSINHYSNTDTEVLLNLVAFLSKDYSVLQSIKNAMKILVGKFAFILIDKNDSDKIYFSKRDMPLLYIYKGNGFEISSDQSAFLEGQQVYDIDNNSYGFLGKKTSCLLSISYEYKNYSFISNKSNDLNNNKNIIMYNEIKYQKCIPQNILKNAKFNNDLLLSIKNADRVVFLGAGTSFYASLYIKNLFEKKVGKECVCYVASEFPFTYQSKKQDVYILLSQSGETADLIRCIDIIKDNISIVITNSINSTLAHKCNFALDIFAGSEISVASTKAYTGMILTAMALCLSLCNEDIALELENSRFSIINALGMEENIKRLARIIAKSERLFYLGKANDYNLCLEMALKMREITYVDAYAFQSGEFKHGSIALINKKSIVIGICSNKEYKDLVIANVKETESRGAKTYYLGFDMDSDFMFYNQGITRDIQIIIFGQLLAYYTALFLKRNIDQPKNLAKSVTVE